MITVSTFLDVHRPSRRAPSTMYREMRAAIYKNGVQTIDKYLKFKRRKSKSSGMETNIAHRGSEDIKLTTKYVDAMQYIDKYCSNLQSEINPSLSTSEIYINSLSILLWSCVYLS